MPSWTSNNCCSRLGSSFPPSVRTRAPKASSLSVPSSKATTPRRSSSAVAPASALVRPSRLRGTPRRARSGRRTRPGPAPPAAPFPGSFRQAVDLRHAPGLVPRRLLRCVVLIGDEVGREADDQAVHHVERPEHHGGVRVVRLSQAERDQPPRHREAPEHQRHRDGHGQNAPKVRPQARPRSSPKPSDVKGQTEKPDPRLCNQPCLLISCRLRAPLLQERPILLQWRSPSTEPTE
jgi:hypothetical protein